MTKRTTDEILRDLGACKTRYRCDGCSYIGKVGCRSNLLQEVYDLITTVMDRGETIREAVQTASQPPEPWTRGKVLDKARECVYGQREQDYGSPERSFETIAALWGAYKGCEFNAVDAAVMLGLLKVARIASNPGHMDNWVDLAGYSACGGEIAGQGVAHKG